MKTLSPIICFLFSTLFFFSTPQYSYAVHNPALINLIIVPKKAKKKKGNWRDKIGLSLLEKHLEKRIKKLQAKEAKKAKKRTSTAVKKNEKKQTHPLAIVAAALLPLGILLSAFFAPILSFGAIFIFFGTSLAALITGIAALARIRQNPTQYQGKKWAIIGAGLGILALLAIATFIILVFNSDL